MTEILQELECQDGTRYVVVDLEATCWPKPYAQRSEIIEIGAVVYEVGRGVLDEFQAFVRPVENPTLSDYCIDLTTIRQDEVDGADGFPEVFARFFAWCAGAAPYILASWGDYDLKQLGRDCELHRLPCAFERHISLKSAFAKVMACKKCGMDRALEKSGLPLSGTHHRGIDDARNIAKLLELMIAKRK